GAIVDEGGGVLAARGDSDAVAELVRDLGAAGGPGSPTEEPRLSGGVIKVPLALERGRGALAVIAGLYTPVFSSDEVTRLTQYTAAIAAALDRVRLVEALRHSEGRYRVLNEELETRVRRRTAELEA